MVENDAKGWYGSFSSAGRNSAEKYNLTALKDKKVLKKFITKDFFSQNEPEPSIEDDDPLQHVDIFSDNYSKQIPNSPNKAMHKSKSEADLNYDRYKYHNKHLNEVQFGKKKEQNPPCTKYNPKMDIIWKKIVTGPKWKTLVGRNMEIPVDNKEFYFHYNDEANMKTGFIDMNKQTMRNGFPVEHDLRIRYEKKFTPFMTANNTTSIIKKYKSSSQSSSRKEDSNDYNSRLTFHPGKSLLLRQHNIKRSYKSNSSLSSLRAGKRSKKGKLKYSNSAVNLDAPDFKKTLSREDVDKIKSIQKINLPLYNPNSNPIMSRTVMMVSYDTGKIPKKIQSTFKGVDHSLTYNLDKLFNKYNKHKPVSVPLFKNMVSRPMDNNDPLPSFMKNMFTRAGATATTDKTLKMNNFAEGTFMEPYSSFYGKKSFNKMINLSMIGAENLEQNFIDTKSEFGSIGNYLSKSMRFYSKNYDDLVSENQLEKFDNVTLKKIKNNSKTKLSAKELQRFNINFEECE